MNTSNVVEVQFRPGATGTAAALAKDALGFLQGGALGAAESAMSAGVRAVLVRHKLQAGGPSFRSEHIDAEAERLVQAAALGAAAPDPLAGQPLLQSFVRLEFATPEDAAAAAVELRKLAEVEKARRVLGAAPPNAALTTARLLGTRADDLGLDPNTQLERQWYLHRLRVPSAWELGASGAGVVVADIDWGCRTSHRDLQDRLEMKFAYNSIDGSREVSQGAHTAHGTGVLGLAGAAGRGEGMTGVAPEAMLWPIQAGDGKERLLEPDPWANAIEYVRRTNSKGRRKVIILEAQTGWNGNYEQYPSVNAMICRAIEAGIVVCVAAGNGDRAADLADEDDTPIDPTGSILVGATRWDPQENRRTKLSNWGPRIVVSAPGDRDHDLTCAGTADDAYTNTFGGTSGAAPKVAGVAALMLSVNPTLSHAQVREILRGTGTKIAPESGGDAAQEKPIGVFLNAEAAVREALRRPGAIVAATPAAVGVQPSVHIEGLTRQAPPSQQPSQPPSALEFTAAALPPAPPPPTDRTLREFRTSTSGVMSYEEQLLAIDQAILLLNLFYVHRPLKEAIHAVRPIQRLRVLRRQLEEDPSRWTARNELQFHKLLTSVFMSLHDLHTNYLLPEPYRDYTAYLPFLVRPYYDEKGRRRYLVTDVIPGYPYDHAKFGRGAEILYWNGVAIDDAVELNAQQTAGSNEAARFVRGVDALVLRPMNVALPPDADWTYITFRPDNGADDEQHDMRQNWLVRFTPLDDTGAASSAAAQPWAGSVAGAGGNGTPPARPALRSIQNKTGFSVNVSGAGANDLNAELFVTEDSPAARPAAGATPPTTARPAPDPRRREYEVALGLDVVSDAMREVKHLIFKPQTVEAASQRAVLGSTAGPALENEDVASTLPLVFQAAPPQVRQPGVRVRADPHLCRHRPECIRAGVHQPCCAAAARRPDLGCARQRRGAYLCGRAPAADANPQPHRARTPAVHQHGRHPRTLPAEHSVRDRSLPLAQVAGAGSHYGGDLFAGAADHRPRNLQCDWTVLPGTGRPAHRRPLLQRNRHLRCRFPGPRDWSRGRFEPGDRRRRRQCLEPRSAVQPLCRGRLAAQAAAAQDGHADSDQADARVGSRAGTLLEDFGVQPAADALHRITRRDLLENDADMLEFAAGKFKQQNIYQLDAVESRRTADSIQFKIKAQNITRVDFYLNGHPATSVEVEQDGDLPPFQVKPGTLVELRGFARDGTTGQERCVAAYRRQAA